MSGLIYQSTHTGAEIDEAISKIPNLEQQINDLDAEVVAHKAEEATESEYGHVRLSDLPKGKRVARFVVGTSTSGWTEKDCDYLCDGTNDQEEINQAIQALPTNGGEVIILDGTYNITAKINVTKNNVSIRGNGNATILKRMFNSSTKEGVITLTNKSGCKIANLQIDGNQTSYTSSNNSGIYLTLSSNNTITGNTCNNSNYGISLPSSINNTVTGNTCNNNSSYGIYLYSSSSDNTVTSNTYNNNNYGIYLEGANNNTVTGNTCNNNNRGIYSYSSSNTSNNNNTITGNTCIRGTGQTSDYTSSQYTIYLSGTNNNYNLISSNNCMGKAVVVAGGTGNTVINNKWNETSDFEDLRADVGDKSSLTTDVKTNLVSAINEHETQINDLDANKVDNSRVLTDVPVNAKFTDTTYSEISTSEIDAGTSSTLRTITGRRVKYLLDKVQGWINALTKSDIGLGDVENYSIATQSEAESGTANNRYMTPLGTKQAINTHNICESSHQDIRQQINSLDAYAVASGTDTYTATIDGYTLVEGKSVKIKFTNANTSASTLNINSLGAKAIKKSNGDDLSSGNIKAGQICNLVYTGSVFQLLGEGGEYGTATASDVLQGKTIGTESGLVTGTIPSKTAQTYTPGTTNQVIEANQFLSGAQTILGDPDLVSTNIKSGANIFGVAGNSNVVDTSAGTAAASHILSGYKAYVEGSLLTGTMANQGTKTSTLTTQGSSYTIPEGYHSGSGKVTANFTNLTAENVKEGVNIGGVVGTYAPLAGYTWTQRTSSFDTSNIYSVCYGQGMFVAVGASGKLATSTDGITWTQRTSSFDTSNTIRGVCYGQGMFVAVGVSGKLATSTDGITWTQRTSSFGAAIIYGVCYGQGMFVAVGQSGKLATSTDGITWTQRTSSFDTSTIYGICYGQGMFVAVGSSGKLATSTDGITWTQRTSGFDTSTINGVCYGQGMFVAVGNNGKLATSTDGITWTQRTSSFDTSNTIRGVCYGQGMFVAVGASGKLATSANIH